MSGLNDARRAGLVRPVHEWLLRNRTSSRAAFVLRTVSIGVSSLLTLWWARLLVHALGTGVYGTYLSFSRVAQLGGIGDLGISGSVGIRVAQHLARDEEEPGRRLLANARGAYLVIAIVSTVLFLGLCPWLPGWLGFKPVAGTGSLPILFALAGPGMALTLFTAYAYGLNYVHGNVTWITLPAFVVTQLSFAVQFALARSGAPLWMQYGGTIVIGTAGLACALWMLKISHPWLGNVKPVRLEWIELRQIIGSSFFVYLTTLGQMLYVTMDDLLVNAGFGASQVPGYRFNYKLCELTTTFITTASFVAMPGIVSRVLSLNAAEAAIGVGTFRRVQQFQSFAGCVAAVVYLAFNDLFILLWQGRAFQTSLVLQAAFALNLAIAMAGDATLQLRMRLDTSGMRITGIALALTALLNLGLSLLAVRLKYLPGIAMATIVAQSVLSLIMSRAACRRLGLSWPGWLYRALVVPVLFVGAFVLCREHLTPESASGFISLAVLCLLFGGAVAAALGIRWHVIGDELRRIRSIAR